MIKIEENGNRYGRLLVLKEVGKDKQGNITWLCKCDCGKEKITNGTALRYGDVKSCGCLHSRTGDKNPRWKGGKYLNNQGYISISVGVGKRIFEHRLVVEKAIGRKLKRNEIVHHINGIRHDNRNCNLLVCDRSYHTWLHMKMAELYAKEHFGDI